MVSVAQVWASLLFRHAVVGQDVFLSTHQSNHLHEMLSKGASSLTPPPQVLAPSGAPVPAPMPDPPLGPSPTLAFVPTLPHCVGGATADGWPMFKSRSELQLDQHWSQYFQIVYGSIPDTGYPICIGALSHLYKPALKSAGVTLKVPASSHCPTSEGEYYSTMTDHQDSWSSWIWHSNLATPITGPLSANTWVEIIHQKYGMDGDAAWMYYAPGMAIWFNLGRTSPWTDHDDAVSFFLHESCQGGGGWGPGDKECISQFPRLYKAALAAGMDSLQFSSHADMPCGAEAKRSNMAIEIVDLGGPGTTTCGHVTGQATRYRAGWEAESSCDCDPAFSDTVNCAGFGVRGSAGPLPTPVPTPAPTPSPPLQSWGTGWCLDQNGDRVAPGSSLWVASSVSADGVADVCADKCSHDAACLGYLVEDMSKCAVFRESDFHAGNAVARTDGYYRNLCWAKTDPPPASFKYMGNGMCLDKRGDRVDYHWKQAEENVCRTECQEEAMCLGYMTEDGSKCGIFHMSDIHDKDHSPPYVVSIDAVTRNRCWVKN